MKPLNISERKTSILLKLSRKQNLKKKKQTVLNSFHEATITLIPRPDKGIKGKKNYRPIYFMNIDVKPQQILAN